MSDETVVNHIAKYHYGIHFQEKYDSRKHEEQDKVWDMVECEWKAYHQMRWYISRVSSEINMIFGSPNDIRATISPRQTPFATTGTRLSPTATNSRRLTLQSTIVHHSSHLSVVPQVLYNPTSFPSPLANELYEQKS